MKKSTRMSIIGSLIAVMAWNAAGPVTFLLTLVLMYLAMPIVREVYYKNENDC